MKKKKHLIDLIKFENLIMFSLSKNGLKKTVVLAQKQHTLVQNSSITTPFKDGLKTTIVKN